MKRYTPFRQLFAIASLALFSGICGACSEPEYHTNYSPYQYQSSYSVDITLLSEWAGHILPENKSFGIRIPTDNAIKSDCTNGYESCPCYYGQYLQYQYTEESKCNLLKSFAQTGNDTNDGSRRSNIICIKAENSDQQDSKYDEYTCSYYTSGSANITKLWESLKRNGVPQIRLGSGDSFGVSAAVSSNYSDIPTAIMLNAMGFTADTFGNHSFDQQLSYLQNVISFADYQYVSSNFKNVPQNLNGVSPYALIRLSDAPESTVPPILAIVSAIDMDANATVFPGRFGTLEISDYCEVIHAIEMAYNQGARSFFILGHILTDSKSMSALLNALFSFADENYQIFDAHQLDRLLPADSQTQSAPMNASEIKVCKSMIEIPSEVLLENFGQDNLNKILSNKKNFDRYNQLVKAVKRQIFNGIIGIFGEGSQYPRLVSFKLPQVVNGPLNTSDCAVKYQAAFNDHIEFQPNGCKSITYNNANWTFTSSFINNNKLPYFNRIDDRIDEPQSQHQETSISNPGCYDGEDQYNDIYLYSDISPCHILEQTDAHSQDVSAHPIWLIQLPSYGTATAQLNVSIQQNTTKESGFAIANAYTADLTRFEMRPVLALNQTIDNSSANYDYCTDNLLIPKACINYYDPNAKGSKDVQACLNALAQKSHSAHKTSAPNRSEFVQQIQNMLECIYESNINVICYNNNEPEFTDVPHFVFPSTLVAPSTESQDRNISTFRTNLATTSVLRKTLADNQAAGETPVVLINAGAIKARDVTRIDRTVLKELVPFANEIVHISIKPSELKAVIETAIESQQKNAASDFGGFPTFAGLHVSVELPNTTNNLPKPVVREMWLTDKDEKLIRPLLVAMDENSGPMTACGKECIFADYQSYDETSKNLNAQINKEHTDDDNPESTPYTMYADKANRLYVYSSDGTSEKTIDLYVPDYLATGGDEYKFPPYTIAQKKLISEYIKEYLKINEDLHHIDAATNTVQEGTTCETYESQILTTKTDDNLSPTELACILSVRRYYRIGDNDQKSYFISEMADRDCKTNSEPENIE